jgi:hypothetical protein
VTRRQKTIAFFVTLCVLLVTAAVSLNVGWILISGTAAGGARLRHGAVRADHRRAHRLHGVSW